MIPARMGSKRVPKKNIRLLAGRPLISYALKSAQEAKVFDEIYLNSEDEMFRKIALEHNVSFYKRPEIFSTDQTNNDEFLKDFIENVEGDLIVQLLPTSPFIRPNEIKEFVHSIIKNKELEALVSVINHQIAGVFNNQPINFSQDEPHIASQEMKPVQTYATVLMAWRKTSLLERLNQKGFGYHGTPNKTGYFPLNGLAKIDIDNEEDFQLADFIMKYQLKNPYQAPQYYTQDSKGHSEVDVPSILVKDGIFESDFDHENLPLSDIDKILEQADNSVSWCRRIVNTESNSATLISQLPGEGNRLHYHPNWNEWWYIIRGEWEWEVEGETMPVKQGQMVFIPKNKWHKITAIGDKPAVRLAVSRADVAHIYKDEEI